MKKSILFVAAAICATTCFSVNSNTETSLLMRNAKRTFNRPIDFMRILLLISFVCVFGACNLPDQQKRAEYHYPEFSHVHPVSATVISDSVLLPSMIYDMEVTQDYILLLYLYDGRLLHIFDKTDGKHIKSMLQYGRGPNEMLSCLDFSLDKKQENLSVFDKTSKRLITVNLDSLNHGLAKLSTVSSDYFARANGVYPLENDTLVFKSIIPIQPQDSSRYFRFTNDRVQAHYYNYPVKNDLAFRLYGDYRLTISPDQRKMAAGTLVGTILECFDISEGIDLVSCSYFSEPFLEDSGRRLDYEASGLGFVDLYGTNNYVYASFGGKKTFDHNDIAIFDWDGEPLALLHTNYNLVKICVEPNDSLLYAIAEGHEEGSIIVSFPLHLH